MALIFLPQDGVINPADGHIASYIRVLFILPVIALCIAATFWRALDKYAQYYVSVAAFLAISGILCLLIILESERELVISGSMGLSNISLAVIFLFAASTLRFTYALVTALLSVTVYFGAVSLYGRVDLAVFIPGDFSNVLFVMLIGGFVGWTRESYLRRDYLAQQSLEQQFSNLVDGSIQGVIFHREGRPLFANGRAAEIFGCRAADEITGQTSLFPFLAEFERDRFLHLSAECGKPGNILPQQELQAQHLDGSGIWLDVVFRAADWEGAPAVQLTVIDITERKKQQQTLVKLGQAVEQSPSAVIITDAEGSIEYVNRKFSEVSGYEADEVIGHNPRILKSGALSESIYKDLWTTISAGEDWRGELLNKSKTGELFWESVAITPIRDENNTPQNYLALKEDISLRKEYEQKLDHQTNYDQLTELPNRGLAIDRLQAALIQARRQSWKVGVIVLNLDRFKGVNDSLGHRVGDQILVMAAHRIQECCREGDTAARIAGDEFLIVLPHLNSGLDAENLASRITAAFATPFVIDDDEIFSTVSMGIAIFPGDGEEPQNLLRNADAAMSRSKELGRNTFHFFMPEMNAESQLRMRLENKLRRAVEREEFQLHFQPIVGLDTYNPLGFEVLLRWHAAGMGSVAPARFIPLLEDSDLIVPVGAWVLREACRQAADWRAAGYGLDFIAVNISTRQVRSEGFVDMVAAVLEETGLRPQCLELEVTESLLLDADNATMETLNSLKSLGIMLSIDDFGTGYSSLSYLKKYPFDTLKIDRSFVLDAPNQSGDRALIEAMIRMAHSLDLKVIAEGLEAQVHLDLMREFQCDLAQGYFIARPAPAAEAEGFLKEHAPPSAQARA